MPTITLFPSSIQAGSATNQVLTNPNNVLASDGVFATLSNVTDEGFQYEAMFDFASLPDGATITAWSVVFRGFTVNGDPVEMRAGFDCTDPIDMLTYSWDVLTGPYYLPLTSNGDVELPIPLLSNSSGPPIENVPITPAILKDEIHGPPILAITGFEPEVTGSDLSLDSISLTITYTAAASSSARKLNLLLI